MFGKGLAKSGFGGGQKFGGGGNDFHKGNAPRFGEDMDEEKKVPPMSGDDEGGDEDLDEKKPESDEDEGKEEETIEQIVQLYDQLTPLIEKLRKK